MLFDTHAHLCDPSFDIDRETLIASLPDRDIGLVMDVGCSLATSRMSAALARQHGFIYAAAGSHPDSADEVCDEVLEEYRKLCKLNAKILAIGEIGLDYHYEDIPRDLQKKAFAAQLELARELDMPVIVHEREAHEDGLKLIKQFPQVKGVFHCYSGAAEMARELTGMGWYIGFTGVLTFKNARRAIESALAVPRDRVVIETDCPYMSPEPFRGRRNDPGRVGLVAEKLAQLWEVTPEEAARITYENGRRLYRMD